MKPRIRTTSVAVALAAGAAIFAVPSAANAAVTPAVAGNQLTLTSDGASDNITLGVTAGNISHNLPIAAGGIDSAIDFDPGPGVVTLLSDGSVTLAINAGDGNDNVNVSAPTFSGNPAINGEGGDDIILGTPQVDAIDGGAGNDRITAFRGNETINGGEGNDVIIWNNGDGNDVNVGGNGLDETLITNGNADDQMAVTQNGARVLFARTNAPFTVDSDTMEKLTVTSFAGNDVLTTGPGVALPMNIDAGPGNDSISTGDGVDFIHGDRGDDTVNGGGNDDTMDWNNGDGNDVMNGDAGIDRIENNLGAADDVSTLKVENGRVRYDRTNAPFNLSVGTSEVFELNTFGGNDTLTTVPNLPITARRQRRRGQRQLQRPRQRPVDRPGRLGHRHDDRRRGRARPDRADVETVNRLAVGVPTVKKNANVKKGVATLKVACPAGTTGCNGSVTLLTAKKISVGRVKAQLVLGTKKYTLTAGQTANVKVKLASGTSKLAKKKKLAVAARFLSETGGVTNAKVTLKF